MKVLISTLGRSHFITAASSIIAAGVDAVLFQGWVVENPSNSLWVKYATRIIGRKSFLYGMEKRITPELRERNKGDFLAEVVQTILMKTIGRLGNFLWNWSVKVGFFIHGMRTRYFINHFDVFHIKSGLGQGGAIRTAHRNVKKVLVDQGIAHPVSLLESIGGGGLTRGSFWQTVLKDCLEADLLMVNSDFVKDTFVRQGYPIQKIRVVYLGVRKDFNQLRIWKDADAKFIGSRQEPLKILFTGAFTERKGAEFFLEAIAALLANNRAIRVTVVGTVTLLQVHHECFKEVLGQIEFTGHIPQDQLKQYLSSHHVYLFPSLAEGCAQSGMEAMSAGLCVVATRESGLPIHDGETGFIVPAHNSNSIVNILEFLLLHPERVVQIGRNAAQQLKDYTWEQYAENVKKVYAELCGDQ